MRLYKTKRSKIDNFGLYATKDIKKGTKIIEYKGKVITRKEAEENPKYDNDKAIYLFNLNKRYDLDGDFKFNTARLINHSCDPNCEVTGSGLKVWVHTIKDIKKDGLSAAKVMGDLASNADMFANFAKDGGENIKLQITNPMRAYNKLNNFFLLYVVPRYPIPRVPMMLNKPIKDRIIVADQPPSPLSCIYPGICVPTKVI